MRPELDRGRANGGQDSTRKLMGIEAVFAKQEKAIVTGYEIREEKRESLVGENGNLVSDLRMG